MPENPPRGRQRLTTRIAYDDAKAAVEFLKRAFGFGEVPGQRIERGDGSIILTEVKIGESYLMIATAGGHGIAGGFDHVPAVFVGVGMGAFHTAHVHRGQRATHVVEIGIGLFHAQGFRADQIAEFIEIGFPG